MEHQYKFSVIVPHYDKSITDATFCEGIQCLLDQTYKNFETLIYHDGPLSRPLPDIYKKLPNHRVFVTQRRENNWGHGNRDRGIKQAEGEYIVHLNPDNLLYNNALEEIVKTSEKPFSEYPCLLVDKKTKRSAGHLNKQADKKILEKYLLIGTNNIIIIPIHMQGHFRYGLYNFGSSRNMKFKNHKQIFTGDPAIKNNIDCMQLVMKRELWLSYGGWYDKSKESDGNMYMKFVHENGARYCDKVLGEHR